MPADDTEVSRETTYRLVSEDLNVERKFIDGDTVQVRTVTTVTEHAVEEMLRHQTADIQRVPIGCEVDAMPEIKQQGDLTIVPIVKEVLILHRQMVLVEEIHICRVSTDEPFATTVALREQRAEITRSQPAAAEGVDARSFENQRT